LIGFFKSSWNHYKKGFLVAEKATNDGHITVGSVGCALRTTSSLLRGGSRLLPCHSSSICYWRCCPSMCEATASRMKAIMGRGNKVVVVNDFYE